MIEVIRLCDWCTNALGKSGEYYELTLQQKDPKNLDYYSQKLDICPHCMRDVTGPILMHDYEEKRKAHYGDRTPQV